MRPLVVTTLLFVVIAIAGCEGRIGIGGRGVDHDAGTVTGMDAGTIIGTDAGTITGMDAGTIPHDAAITLVTDAGHDAWVAPTPDAWTMPLPDAYIVPDPTCMTGTPLAAPIAGCMPTPMASTGDPHVDCVIRINQFRCQCQHLPPLMRWTAGEACADQMAAYDGARPGMFHAGFIAHICNGGYGENECPGWPSVSSEVTGCLQQMWDEGPGDFYGPPQHGHYINMSSTMFTMVACGFATGMNGEYAVQNFQ